MELFLLLSIGLSIVSFISIALNQAPPAQSTVEENLESLFPLEAYLLTSEKLNVLKLNDQIISQDFESIKDQEEASILAESSPCVKELQGAF